MWTTTKSKYKNKKTEIDGITFDSRLEAERYTQLKIFERAGLIQNLRLQVPFVLIDKSRFGTNIKYVADFVYEEDGQTVVEDVKGVKTDVYRLKKRLLAERYGIEIKEIGKKDM